MTHFEEQAADWLAWARTPDHDDYWSYRDAFFELVPPPGRATLEVGCGEGRVCRDLAARGHDVTGIDTSLTLLRAAAEAHPEGTYAVADAAALPFEDGTFDLVVAYNSLMDMEDMPGAVREAERVLAPGGALCVCITNPVADLLRPAGDGYTLARPYSEEGVFEGTFYRNDLTMHFRGWTRPLESYARALEAVGLRIEALREPVPPRERGQLLPSFVMWRAAR
ncbi:class I SAM-dependent methyltransferase [Solirubrobacter sp. CPCC 204708]|uniref:Class I SAM-dependent methyltransferase n=1 Tax=Solirubrobacter deserti TaxID=2282478 RepID=A0ABT4RS53_9ACTN|nr:class I SAM-dependent methyltransferase [Solirubrobacter deserti]MBE2315117.1 class I SAM-dependent methyltransferase [Solirubrobacter deserti]MDA0141361.1 class I SAM-dependent methyltransferase [Solirubrobacter deserti]